MVGGEAIDSVPVLDDLCWIGAIGFIDEHTQHLAIFQDLIYRRSAPTVGEVVETLFDNLRWCVTMPITKQCGYPLGAAIKR